MILCLKSMPYNFLLHCCNRPFFIISETATDVIEAAFNCEERLSAHLANLPAWWHHVCHSVVSGIQTLPWDCEESIPRTQAWEILMWQGGLFPRKAASGFPISYFLLSCHGKSPTMSSPRPKQKTVSRVSSSY